MNTFTIRGKRILLNKPHKETFGIELTDAAKAEVDAEMMKKWTALEIYAIGTDVSEVKVGDKVYIPSYVLQSAEIVDLQDEGIKIMIGEQDIAIIW
jgi:co-chaperonin GroES (HSP10)